jgi:Ca2+-binding RTX toxin-like protein
MSNSNGFSPSCRTDIVGLDAAHGHPLRLDLGAGEDLVLVAGKPGGQVRLSFTSAEVGNGRATDGGTLANQDGGLAVRLQAEGRDGTPSGRTSRFDDEGITFVAGRPGLTFDVRDLVAGTARGDRFEVVRLGTEAGEALDAVQQARPYDINASMGNDTVTGGAARDFLVGGAGDDLLAGGGGADSLLGGGGADRFLFAGLPAGGTAPDSLVDFAPGTDLIPLDDAGFAGLAPGAFALSTAAAEADDRVIYDQGSGRLFFDADGGTRDDLVAFAVLAPAAPSLPPALSAADFLIV